MAKAKQVNNKIKVYSTEYSTEYSEEEVNSMMQMFMEHDSFNYDLEIEVGKTLKGDLLGTIGDHIVVDLGYKDFLYVESRPAEFAALQRAGKVSNDKVDVLITEVTDNPYMIKGSFTQLHKKDVVSSILSNTNQSLQAFVKDLTPAGYNVEILYEDLRIPAFMPNTIAGINKLYDPNMIVGKTLAVAVESYDEAKGTFIASRKKHLHSLIPQALADLKNLDAEGNPIPYSGIVTGTTKYGVFVEFNECLTGMIHVANLGEELAATLGDIKPGMPINFFVKENIRGKLILTQVWRVTIWDTIKKDDVFEDARVREMKHIGLLVQLDDQTLGLIHNSELDKKKSYKEGDTIKVKVSQVIRNDRKIHLLPA